MALANEKMNKKLPVVVLTGATAVGKSKLIYQEANDFPLEIICSDARQVYQHLEIGATAPLEEEFRIFRHHLFQFLSPQEKFSAGQFCKLSKKLIDEIHSRKKIPLLVGGTFFYIKSLWDGLIEEPKISDSLQRQVENLSLEKVRIELKQHDLNSWQRIEALDLHRNRRALLMSLATGKPFSSLPKTGGIFEKFNFYSFYLEKAREELYQDINLRTSFIFENGLLPEIETLVKMNYNLETPALNAIGYKEVLQAAIEVYKNSNTEKNILTKSQLLAALKLLQNNFEKLKEVENLVAQKTRNYAKRQITWFRNEKRLQSFSYLEKNIFLQAIQDAKVDIISTL